MVGVAVGCSVGVSVGVAVSVGELVAVAVCVGVAVGEFAGVGVLVDAGVGVFVGAGRGVLVGVGVFVGVDVLVGGVPARQRRPFWRSVAQKSRQSTRPSRLMSNFGSRLCRSSARAITTRSRQFTTPSPVKSAHGAGRRGVGVAAGGCAAAVPRNAGDSIAIDARTRPVSKQRYVRMATPIVNDR